MVLLITIEADQSINYLIDWLDKFEIDFFRFNEEDEVEDLTIEMSNSNFYFDIKIKDKGKISSKKIRAIYYRGGQFLPATFFIEKLSNSQKKYLKEEWDVINSFFMSYFESLPSLGGHFKETRNNKIRNLFLAQKNGLLIPETCITTNQSNVLKSNKEAFISKVLKKEIYYEENGVVFYGEGTIKISRSEISNYSKKFFPTQFQECIDKQFEVRVFFVNEKFFSMAIIPLEDKLGVEENIDYRIGNEKGLNSFYRYVPYCLPSDIEGKVNCLMTELDLMIGSIDFIVNQEGEHIFLEINPVGQYLWVSEICNYNLDKEIAQELKRMINE